MLARRGADASVRPACPADAAAIGAVQARCWRQAYADLAPGEALAHLDGALLADRWRSAIADPPSDRHTVLVACAGSAVVGFAAHAPSADRDATPTDAELVALEVDPAHQRAGHASRLLTACVDTLRASGATTVRVWCPAPDEARHTFLFSAGLRPDGARRDLLGDGATVTELRLSAALGT